MDVEVVFLAGGPHRSLIERLTGWPHRLLPVGPQHCLLACWKEVIEWALGGSGSLRAGSWRLLLSHDQSVWEGVEVSDVGAAYETVAHRGTAGAVLDSLRLNDGECAPLLLVEVSASPVVDLGPLVAAWDQVRNRKFGCVLGASKLGRYCGVALCQRAVFELVPKVGFFDLKEQLLPAILRAGGGIESTVVADRARRVRDRLEWLYAVQAWREFAASPKVMGDCALTRSGNGGERNLIATSASTSGASVVSSIVMDEAIVEPGGVVARSIIGPGMRVPAGARIVDAIFADPAVGEAAISRASTTVLNSAANV